MLAAARGELPGAAPAASSARTRDGQLVITLGKEWGAALPLVKSMAFFPYDEGGIEYAAPQVATRAKDSVELAMKLGDQPHGSQGPSAACSSRPNRTATT